METQIFFKAWFTALAEEFTVEAFFSVVNLSVIGTLFILLYAKIGAIKALFVAPASWLLERSIYSTLELTEQSYFSTLMFVIVTGVFAVYMIYHVFIADHSTCNRI